MRLIAYVLAGEEKINIILTEAAATLSCTKAEIVLNEAVLPLTPGRLPQTMHFTRPGKNFSFRFVIQTTGGKTWTQEGIVLGSQGSIPCDAYSDG